MVKDVQLDVRGPQTFCPRGIKSRKLWLLLKSGGFFLGRVRVRVLWVSEAGQGCWRQGCCGGCSLPYWWEATVIQKMHKLVRTRCSLVRKGSAASPARTLCLSLVTSKIAASIAKTNAAVLEIDFYLLRVVRPLMCCDGMFPVLPVGYDDTSSGDIILKHNAAYSVTLEWENFFAVVLQLIWRHWPRTLPQGTS